MLVHKQQNKNKKGDVTAILQEENRIFLCDVCIMISAYKKETESFCVICVYNDLSLQEAS